METSGTGGLGVMCCVVTVVLGEKVGASAVAGLGLALVDVSLQVADHVGLAGDGDGTHDAVIVSPESPRRLKESRETREPAARPSARPVWSLRGSPARC